MKHFVVERANGCRITSAYGHTPAEARQEAVETLNRPGRYDILRSWQADDMPLRDEETGRCTVAVPVVGTVQSVDIFHEDGRLYAGGQEYNVTEIISIRDRRAFVTDVILDHGERLVLIDGLTAVEGSFVESAGQVAPVPQVAQAA